MKGLPILPSFGIIGAKSLSMLAVLLAGLVLSTFGDILVKRWSLGMGSWLLVCGLALWYSGALVLAWSFKYQNMAVVTTVIVAANLIALVFVSALLFHEPLSAKQIAGVGLATVSLFLLM